jgi:hypothetical protein
MITPKVAMKQICKALHWSLVVGACVVAFAGAELASELLSYTPTRQFSTYGYGLCLNSWFGSIQCGFVILAAFVGLLSKKPMNSCITFCFLEFSYWMSAISFHCLIVATQSLSVTVDGQPVSRLRQSDASIPSTTSPDAKR